MPIGDIQLSQGAAPEPAMAVQAQARAGVVIGEHPEPAAPGGQPELKDTALDRQQVEIFLRELRDQPHWRREADRAVDYYDGNQLSPETVERLQERGQPPLITNIIKPTVDTVLGMEAKSRTDWRVRPEDDDECPDEVAEALSVKLKHAETESRADRAVSDAYAAQIKAGLGWVEVAREHDPFKCPYRVRYIHRREISWDWRGEQLDLLDARYLIRRRWLELDHAIGVMPQYAGLFRQTTGGWAGFDPMVEQDSTLVQSWEVERDTRIAANDWRDIERQRVCLYEIWYRKWVRGYAMRLPNGTTLEFDKNNPRHQEAAMAGIAQITAATFQKVRLAWYCGPHFLYDVPSPYRHGYFPYVPFFGYREDLTGVPYGIIRSMISPQDEINARKAKMLWALNSRRVLADSDAVLDHDRAAAEVARPDAYVILNANRKPTSRFDVAPGGELAVQQFQVMQEAKQEIAEASGIHKSMQGQQSAASSGLAINSLIEQGMNTLAEINDNYRYARRLVGEMLFDLVRQNLMQGPSKVTIGEGAAKKIILLNAMVPDPQTGQPVMVNDISRIKAAVVLDDVPSTPTYKMQQLQMLTEITKSLPPQLQSMVVDFVVEATDMPNRHEMADRIRAAVGIQSPDQQRQLAAQQQQAQQQAQQMAAAEQQAKIQTMTATAQKTIAEAQKIAAEVQAGGALGQAQRDFDQRLADLNAGFEQKMRPLLDQIGVLQQQLADRQLEIQTKAAAEVEKARIGAAATVRAAEVARAGEDATKPLLAALEGLRADIDKLRADDANERKLLAKDIEQARKAAEKKPEPKPEKPEKDDKAMAQMMDAMAKTQAELAALAKAITKPRKTTIIEDKNGRAVAAISTPTTED